MKCSMYALFICILITGKLYSQFTVSISAENRQGNEKLVINGSLQEGQALEGYFLIPRFAPGGFEPEILGKFTKGGFSFLEDQVFGEPVSFLKDKWAKNNFILPDLEPMTNGTNTGKVISFQISRQAGPHTGDSVLLFIKYTIYQFSKENTEFDLNYNIKLNYKSVKVPLGKEETIQQWSALVQNYNFKILLTQSAARMPVAGFSKSLLQEIEASSRKSPMQNPRLSFDFCFVQRKNILSDEDNQSDYYYKYKEQLLRSVYLPDERNAYKTKNTNEVYFLRLIFPFRLMNKNKANTLLAVKANEKLFTSTMNAVLVPLNISGDTLTAELFFHYTKMQDDNQGRWTPIKKVISFPLNHGAVRIDLPKENWSVPVFSSGKQTDIYGFSDFENFVNEYIIIIATYTGGYND